MEVLLRPHPPRWIYWPLTLMTFGLVPILIRMGERGFILRMDSTGVSTRGGRRIGWNEFTGIEHVRSKMKSNVLSDEYILKSSRGNASLPAWRTRNVEEALDYLRQHLPNARR